MYVKTLELQNFRNYGTLSLVLAPGVNIFYGGNAQGKTNLLEAVNLCGTARSHKSVRDKELIRFGETESHLRTEIDKKGTAYRIDVHLRQQGKKGIAVNSVPLKRASELFALIQIVFFSPEDLQLIKSGPIERRKYMDLLLGRTEAVYLSDYVNYHRCLTQRNKLLHEATVLPEQLAVWDAQLVEYGTRIIRRRADFLLELQAAARQVHRGLTGGAEELLLRYEPNVPADGFALRLAESTSRDLQLQTTTVGPQRDDFAITANGVDLRKFGSQGQQRTAALSLKLAEILLIEQKIGEKPVLLLDDVLSELDRERQTQLLAYLKDTQTLLTCTGLDEFVRHEFPADKTYLVENGGIA